MGNNSLAATKLQTMSIIGQPIIKPASTHMGMVTGSNKLLRWRSNQILQPSLSKSYNLSYKINKIRFYTSCQTSKDPACSMRPYNSASVILNM